MSPSSGSGIGTPIPSGPVPPVTDFITWCSGAVKLHDYARILNHYPECAFFGVNNPDDAQVNCRNIWSWEQRNSLARYLCEAQEEIEQEVGYYLSPTWVEDEIYDYTLPIITQKARIIAAGVRAETTILADAPVSHVTDPATVGPIATALTDESEIHLYYPDSDQEIFPSKIEIAGGNLSIWIPRCRMVSDALLQTPDEGLDYNDVSNFQSTVDVKRVYTDTSDQGELVKPHVCSTSISCCGCSEYTKAACVYLRKPKLGIIDVFLTTSRSCNGYSLARLNYYSGMNPTTRQAQDAVIRLAHSKMPSEPCGCDAVHQWWERDNAVPENLSFERMNCRFGTSEGAWISWLFSQSIKMYKGSTI